MSFERNILVVEDDSLVSAIISECLMDWPGTDVDRAASGKIAAEKLRSGQFQFAIIDALLPEIPGLRLIEMAANRDVAILALSGDAIHVEQLASAGCPVLQKPFALETLLQHPKRAMLDRRDNILRVRRSLAILQARAVALDAEMSQSQQLLAASRHLQGGLCETQA